MIVGQFAHEAALTQALGEMRRAQLGDVETFTPAPVVTAEGVSPLPLIILIGGLLTGAASFGLQCASAMFAYPFDIGGRPDFAWPAFVPTAFENGVLGAILAGFFGYLIINRLPRLYDPVDDVAIMRHASRDGWMLQLSGADAVGLHRARALMLELGALCVEERAP